MKKLISIIFFAAIGAGSALAQQMPGGQHMMQPQETGASQKTGKGTGLVQQVDREKGVVTIKHGPLPALNMGAMTMTYTVKDRGQLANLKPLQKVEFDLTYDGRTYLITSIK